MYAELRGNNQGLIKLVAGTLAPRPSGEITIERETPVSAKINGGQRIGMAIMRQAVDLGIKKAKVSGISVVGLTNYASATGALGMWGRDIAREGLIGIVMSQCPEMVAPYGSYEPLFGTNPFTIGVPTTPRPQVLDMATSAYAYFGVVTAQTEGLPIPHDIAYTDKGEKATNPTDALKGALRSFDRSYKGSHIALMVELLAGALTGGAMEAKGPARNWGSLVICIDPVVFGTLEEFQASANLMCNRVKNAKILPDKSEGSNIWLPGERGDAQEEDNLKKGTMELSDEVFEALKNTDKFKPKVL
jgi:L-2-hydroxycarboxylate dehydrogenase (NAD+)